MADNHAYVPAPGTIVPVINHLRNSFPPTVDAGTLKKLGFAPKNESYVINVLRFIGLLDQDGKKTDEASKVFSLHDDKSFQKAFSKMVMKSYKDLFDLHGDKAWTLDTDSLITFFRQSDQTSAITGKRQATTFSILAAFSGIGEIPQTKQISGKQTNKNAKPKAKAKVREKKKQIDDETDKKKPLIEKESPIGLTVRIEINLPADGDQNTYDRIFKSIRENLLNG
jgi:hypothetical protein